jgi:hypothetical protein
MKKDHSTLHIVSKQIAFLDQGPIFLKFLTQLA